MHNLQNDLEEYEKMKEHIAELEKQVSLMRELSGPLSRLVRLVTEDTDPSKIKPGIERQLQVLGGPDGSEYQAEMERFFAASVWSKKTWLIVGRLVVLLGGVLGFFFSFKHEVADVLKHIASALDSGSSVPPMH